MPLSTEVFETINPLIFKVSCIFNILRIVSWFSSGDIFTRIGISVWFIDLISLILLKIFSSSSGLWSFLNSGVFGEEILTVT